MIRNPKYKPNKKNGGKAPKPSRYEVQYIPIGCGNCIECRKKKQREWRVRLLQEHKDDPTGIFVTLTFSEEKLNELIEEIKTEEANEIARIAIRRFLENWRSNNKKSVKHWLIPELGHRNTERLHIHGIIYTENKEEIQKRWTYGIADTGYSMNEKCINYVVKYITKEDGDHKGFRGKIFPSPGLGKGYLKTYDFKKNKYKGEETDETYKLNNGQKIGLPTYYRNKAYTEEEKEKLWMEKVDKQEIYVMGQKIKNIDTEKGKKELEEAIKYARKISKEAGYGSGEGKKEFAARKKVEKV